MCVGEEGKYGGEGKAEERAKTKFYLIVLWYSLCHTTNIPKQVCQGERIEC